VTYQAVVVVHYWGLQRAPMLAEGEMQPIRRVWPSERGVVFEVESPADRVVDLLIDGRRVWSFREPATPPPPELLPDGPTGEHLRFQPWPPVLQSRLTGRFQVGLRPVSTDANSDAPVEATACLGDGITPADLTDVYGRPLVVNKWGRLGHTLADAPEGLVDRMLDHMDEIRDLLLDRLGPSVFVTGGTLLGPIRGAGRLIPHDDDADLAYLSDWTSPADVARENFELGRLLCERGYDVIRLSAAHVQMHFTHEGVPDHYVDVFGGFLLDGIWYQHFAIRAEASREQLLPAGTLVVEGRSEPAPRDPEFMLRQLFGPGWPVPDPAFSFDSLPMAIIDRFSTWFPDLHADRESWEDLVLLGDPAAAEQGDRPSAFADWVDRHTPPDHGILELGSGLGADARALGARGRLVHAVDFSRFSVEAARARLPEPSPPVTFGVVNLLDLRVVLRLGAECAAADHPWTIYGRRLLNAVEPPGRDHVFRLCSMLLRGGGAAHFDVVTDPTYTGVPPHLRPTVDDLVQESARHGLVLDEASRKIEPMTWVGTSEEHLVELTRMTLRRRP
jgi:hypothetical protein